MSKDSILFRCRCFIFVFAFVCMSFFGFNKASASASVSMPEDLQILYRNYINTYVQKTPTCNSYYIGYLDGEYYLYVMPRVSDAKYVSGDIEFYFAKNYYGDSDTLCAYVFSSSGLIRTDNLSLDGNFNLTGVHPSTPVFSNIDIYNTDGTVFFQQRPLAGSILIKAKVAALEKDDSSGGSSGSGDSDNSGFFSSIVDFLTKISEKVAGLASSIVGGIGDFFTTLTDNLGNWFGSVITWFSNLFTNLGNWFTTLFNNILSLPQTISDLFKKLLNALFVPEDGFLNNKISELKASLAKKFHMDSYNQLVDALQSYKSGQYIL